MISPGTIRDSRPHVDGSPRLHDIDLQNGSFRTERVSLESRPNVGRSLGLNHTIKQCAVAGAKKKDVVLVRLVAVLV
jgi:hypothetical protein